MNKVPILSYSKVNEFEEFTSDILRNLKKDLNFIKLREKFEDQVDSEDKELLNVFISHLKEEDYEIIYKKIEYWLEKALKFVRKNVKEFQKETDSKIIIEQEYENLKNKIEEKRKTILNLNEKINESNAKVFPIMKEKIKEHFKEYLVELDKDQLIIQKKTNENLINNKLCDVVEHFSSINEKKTFEIIEDYMKFQKKLKEAESSYVSNLKNFDENSLKIDSHLKNLKILQKNLNSEKNLLNSNIFF